VPAIQAFSSLCEHNDWQPVFYQTLPATLELYKSARFDSVCVGHEAIVKLDTFSLDGKAGKPLRTPVNKLTKAGYKFLLHEPPIPDEVLEELRTISNDWLTKMHGTEQKFSLGWFEDNYVRSSPIATVISPEGWITAFANIVPEYQASEVSIDLMRYRHPLENGTMEYLFVNLFLWAAAQGCHSFNLGLSALSGVGEQADDPALERVMHFIYENVNQFYNFKGLHAFKEKFNPEWSPRYLIYRGTANLAQAWLGVTQANSGGSNLLYEYFMRK
jgi:phosphatidylglycerol lysyltransferase